MFLMCRELSSQGTASDNLNAAAGPARVHMAVAQEQCLHLLHNPGVYAIDLLLCWVVCLCQRDGIPNLECSEAVKGRVSKAGMGGCSGATQAALQQPSSGRKALCCGRQCNLCCPAQAGSKLRQAVRLGGPPSRHIACPAAAHQRHDVLLVGNGQAPAPPKDACSRHLLLSATLRPGTGSVSQPHYCLPVETFNFLESFCSPKKLNTCSQGTNPAITTLASQQGRDMPG